MRPRVRLAALAALALAAICGQARAETADPRFIIDLRADPEAGLELATLHADIRLAARKALPLLWRRVIPAADLPRAPGAANAIRLLRRAAPTAEGVRIEFDKARVRAMLEKEGLGFIPDAPRWAVSLRLRDWRGQPMDAMRQALRARLAQLAPQLGIVIDPAGDPLELAWIWLGPRQVALRLRGAGGEQAETRWLETGGEEEMARWLEEALMRARDALATQPAPEAAAPDIAPLAPDAYAAIDPYASRAAAADPYAAAIAPAMPPLALRLTIEDDAQLADRVIFEEALRRRPQVAALTPEWLDARRRVYRLRLRRPGDAWLAAWLRERGYAVERDAERGWLASRP